MYLGSQICNVTMINFFFFFFSEMLNLSQKKLTKNDGQHIVFIVPTVKSAFSLYQHVASSSTRLFVDSSLLFLRVDRQDKMLHKDIIQEILNGKLRKLWKVLFKILIRITRLTLRERGKKRMEIITSLNANDTPAMIHNPLFILWFFKIMGVPCTGGCQELWEEKDKLGGGGRSERRRRGTLQWREGGGLTFQRNSTSSGWWQNFVTE